MSVLDDFRSGGAVTTYFPDVSSKPTSAWRMALRGISTVTVCAGALMRSPDMLSYMGLHGVSFLAGNMALPLTGLGLAALYTGGSALVKTGQGLSLASGSEEYKSTRNGHRSVRKTSPHCDIIYEITTASDGREIRRIHCEDDWAIVKRVMDDDHKKAVIHGEPAFVVQVPREGLTSRLMTKEDARKLAKEYGQGARVRKPDDDAFAAIRRANELKQESDLFPLKSTHGINLFAKS